MNLNENIDLEFKEIYVPDIKKEVIAFANTQGGKIYIGIRKDGVPVGVEQPDEVMIQVANALKDSIRPDIMPFVNIQSVLIDGKILIEIAVNIGTGRPYYLHDKGLKPSGVYVRKGSSSQPLSDEGIRKMIIENSGKSYETSRSMNQNLTFSTFEEEMKCRNLEIGPVQMRTLHLIDDNGLYTNLALLLSDQCEHTIKIAFFQGKDKEVFRDRKEIGGSLLKQLKEVFQVIELYNKTKATFNGLNRIDKKDYPIEAIREALLNCIVHRDYSFSASTLINCYEDRIEFVSLGGLIQGISMEAIFMGVSQSRNMNLANVFYRMQLIESYGTGISKICRVYKLEKRQPGFDTATGVFRVVLPNCNEEVKYTKIEEERIQYEITNKHIADSKERILAYAREKRRFKRKEIEYILGLKQTRSYILLKELCDEGVLRKVGNGKNSFYELNAS